MSRARTMADLARSTASSTELNILDGVTTSTAELNLLDGVAGLVQADLTKLAAVDASAIELDYNNITTLGTSQASKVLTANSTGHVTISDTIVVGNNGTDGLRLGGVLVTTTGTALNNAATTGKSIAMAIVFGG